MSAPLRASLDVFDGADCLPRPRAAYYTLLYASSQRSSPRCAEAREQIEFVRRYHDTMRHEDGAVAGGGDPDLSAGGYRR